MSQQASSLIEPSVLLLGSRLDLTCDYVVSQLRQLGTSYLRLNSEDLPDLPISMDPVARVLSLTVGTTEFRFSPESLGAVLYRRPVFLREYGDLGLSPLERFQRHQWGAFIRSCMVFREAAWMNHPGATYVAEHKAVQLATAARVGFNVPRTFVSNTLRVPNRHDLPNPIAVKGIDTVLLRTEGHESFGFTTYLDLADIHEADLQAAPTVLQQVIEPKIDIRVTVVGKEVFPAAIRGCDGLVAGDWRVDKARVQFVPHGLPAILAERCCRLVSMLGLSFGAIDLALRDEDYYFLEINPTGEWAWLVDEPRLPIDRAIAEWLSQPRRPTK